MGKLSNTVKKIFLAIETLAAGSPALLAGGYVDRTGWKYATWTISVGVTDCVVDLKIQECDDAATWVDIDGAAVTQFAGTDDGKTAVIEIPLTGAARKRYQKPVCVVGAGTGAAIAIECELSDYSPNVADVAPTDLKQVVVVA